MTVEQVLTLLDKGFSRDDIMKLTETSTEQVGTDHEPEAEHEEQQEQQEQQETQQEQQEQTDRTEERLNSIEKSITSLVKAIQAQNIRKDFFSDASITLDDETDKIMKSIIRQEPARKDDKK